MADSEYLARLVDDVLRLAIADHAHHPQREELDGKIRAVAEALQVDLRPPTRGEWSQAEREAAILAIAEHLSPPVARALRAAFGLW
jgi:hypothetical protein